MYIFDDVTMKGLMGLIYDKRDEALKEGQKDYRCVFSRGTWLSTADAKGNQCDPSPEAACHKWNGSKKEIDMLISFVKGNYPDVARIYISGGYDGATSLTAYYNEDYEPWVSYWSEDVWTKES